MILKICGRGGIFAYPKFCAPAAQAKFLLRNPGFQKHKAVYVFEIPFKSLSSHHNKTTLKRAVLL